MEDLPKQMLIVLAFLMMLAIGVIVFASETSKSSQKGNESENTINRMYIYAPRVPYYLVSVTLGSIVEAVIQCESGGQHTVNGELLVGDTDLKVQAFGIGQFQKSTFTWLAELSGREELKIENEQEQLWLLNWAIENGYGELWTCYSKS